MSLACCSSYNRVSYVAVPIESHVAVAIESHVAVAI